MEPLSSESVKTLFDQEFPKASRNLRRQVSDWVSAGLIETDHARRLLEYHSQTTAGQGRNLMGVIMSSIAGLFVLTGIILLIAEHWNGIPRGIKLLGGLILLSGFQGIGWFWKDNADAIRRWIAQGFLLAGGGMILGMIALVSQIYNLNSRPPNGVLLWLLLLAPMPWLTRSTSLWLMALGVFTSWLGMEFAEPDSLLYAQNFSGGVWLWTMLGLILWSVAEARRTTFHPIGIGFARYVGAAIFLGTTLAFSFHIENFFHLKFRNPWAVAIFAWVAPILWFSSRWLESESTEKFRVLDIVIFGFWAAIFLGLFVQPSYLGPILWAIHLVLCILLVREGAEEGRVSWINLGISFILISVLCRYFSFFKDYLRGGIFFITTGLFFFGLVWFLEKQRRYWASKARKNL